MIRKLSKKDISHVSDMIKTYLEISHEYKEFNEERLLNTLKLVLDEPNNLFVIVNDEDAAIGYINFHILNFPLISGKELYISELIVHEGERSKNLGTKLINFAIGSTIKMAKTQFRLNINANNLLDKNYINHLSRLKPDGINNMGRNIILSLNFDL